MPLKKSKKRFVVLFETELEVKRLKKLAVDLGFSASQISYIAIKYFMNLSREQQRETISTSSKSGA